MDRRSMSKNEKISGIGQSDMTGTVETEVKKDVTREKQAGEVWDADADQKRRLRVIMEELRAEDKLTEEEEEKVFGRGGYLERIEAGEVLNAGKHKKERKKRKRKWTAGLAKVAAVVVLIAGCIFAANMSTEANREHLVDKLWTIRGNGVVVSIDNEDNRIQNRTEEEARQDILEQVQIEAPFWDYRDEEMSFQGYEIFQENKNAFMYYIVRNEKIVLQMFEKQGKETAYYQFEGDSTETIDIFYDQIKVRISHYENEDGSTNYDAQWEYKNVIYKLSGCAKKEDFYKILKKMNF